MPASLAWNGSGNWEPCHQRARQRLAEAGRCDIGSDQVQPRRRKRTRRMGTGTPTSQRRIQPTFPESRGFPRSSAEGLFTFITLSPIAGNMPPSPEPLVALIVWAPARRGDRGNHATRLLPPSGTLHRARTLLADAESRLRRPRKPLPREKQRQEDEPENEG